MKQSILILVFSIFIFNTAKAQKYFGKSYPATQNVDEYYDSNDVKKPHIVMGRTELLKGFRSLEKSQEKILELAKQKGADGVIFSIEENVYGSSNSGSATAHDKKKSKTTVTTSGTTVDLKQQKINAVFIKYNK
jgi:hypothetical protein